MSAIPPDPQHVSETALMVAAARAMETVRPDGIVQDVFAAELAGDRGMALTRGVPGLDWMMLGIAIRCRFVDELLLQAFTMAKDSGHAISTVVALGAGLDARPWRLDLPPGLRWIDVDFADILNYKAARLSAHHPKCHVERVQADLDDQAGREAVFEAAGEAPALMISEGLIMYLQPATVEALADASPASDGLRYWVLDVFSKDLMSRAHQDWKGVENLRPKDHLRGAQILDLARRHGWKELARRTYTRDAWSEVPERIRAVETPVPMADERNLPSGEDPSGVYLFGR
jgi:methyltransferase (TIGR00027 family)